MTEAPSLAELISLVVFLGGLGLSCWALVDDIWDLTNVYRFGEIGGPRWVSAMEHFQFNGLMLVGWSLLLGLTGIAIYLPSRNEQTADFLSLAAGWLRLGAGVAFLVAQVARRVGRVKLQHLPLEAWETMLASMFDGMSVQDRTALMGRLLKATSAGREMGHAVRNHLQVPVALLDEIANDPKESEQRRSDAIAALDEIERIVGQVGELHAVVKAVEGQP